MKFTKKDIIAAPFTLLPILVLSMVTTLFFRGYLFWLAEFRAIATLVVFYLTVVFWTCLVLKGMRWFVPLKEGTFSLEKDQGMVFWKLQQFLYIFNLGLLMNAGLIPINLRGFFYSLLGAEIGKSVMIGGKILDPPLVEIEHYSQLGEDSIATVHGIAKNKVTLGKIKIGRDVTVGTKAVILPGVQIGDGAVVAAGSVVVRDTKIPPGEIWGGVPAKKIR